MLIIDDEILLTSALHKLLSDEHDVSVHNDSIADAGVLIVHGHLTTVNTKSRGARA